MDPKHYDLLLSHYDAFYAIDDSANAVAMKNRMVDADYAALKKTHGRAPDRSLPGIICSFQPKSGGTFLHHRMLDIGYREFYWGFAHRMDRSTVFAVPKAVKLFLRGGCACHSHFLPHPHNMDVLDAAGVKQVWVHLRNPAESVVSAYYHYLGIGHGGGDFGRFWSAQALEEAKELQLKVEHTPEGQNEFVQKSLEYLVFWVETWAAFAKTRPGYVLFTTQAEMRDLRGLLGRVLAAFGGALPEGAVFAEGEGERVRTKGSTDWREGLMAETVAFVEARLAKMADKYPEVAALLRLQAA